MLHPVLRQLLLWGIKTISIMTMKSLFAPLFIFAALLASSLSADVQQASPQQFAALIGTEDTLLIDVRTPAETKEAKLENAQELDYNAKGFAEKLLELPQDKTLLIYCRSGNRSGQAAAFLESKGYTKIVNLAGGINAWKAAKLPIVSR